jgi:hypothetical protein
MTDKPAPTLPREPLALPSNGRDVTAEKVGTVIAIVGRRSRRRIGPRTGRASLTHAVFRRGGF